MESMTSDDVQSIVQVVNSPILSLLWNYFKRLLLSQHIQTRTPNAFRNSTESRHPHCQPHPLCYQTSRVKPILNNHSIRHLHTQNSLPLSHSSTLHTLFKLSAWSEPHPSVRTSQSTSPLPQPACNRRDQHHPCTR